MNRELARAASSKGDGVEYVIMGTEDGAVICGCPGFSYRRNCRHVREYVEAHPEGVRVVLDGEDLLGAARDAWVAGQECSASPDGKHLFTRASGRRRCWWCHLEEEK